MIHFDRNHTSAITTHPKSNLILNSPHADQHSILSWSTPARDDTSFYQEHQEQHLADQTSPSSIVPAAPPLPHDTTPNPDHSSSLEPVNPGDAEEPKISEPSPSSTTNATSPALESSSSLTPPPDTTSPVFPTVSLAATESTTTGAGQTEEGENNEKAEEVDKASRASTPLSELSSAPDVYDHPPQSEKNQDHGVVASEERPKVDGSKAPLDPPSGGSSVAARTRESNGHVESSKLEPSIPVEALVAPSTPQQRSVLTQQMNDVGSLGELAVKAGSPLEQQHSVGHSSTTPVSGSPSKTDPKVDSVLELNTHLLKVFMELQARKILTSDPRCQQYSMRLQSNLTWLAAAADQGRKVPLSQIALPIMHAPPAVEFVSMDRIQRLYGDLPALFAKEVARSQPMRSNASSPPTHQPNGNLKRNRPDDQSSDLSSKRRDTGETKTSTPVPIPSISQPAPTNQPSGFTAQSTASSHSLPLTVTPSMGSPSMPPPSVSSGMLGGPNDAQLAALRNRQIQQMQMRQVAQQQQLAEGMRRMSPTAPHQSPMPSSNMAGPSSIPPQILAQLQLMGPGAVQNYQALQNPSNTFVQYMNSVVRGFSSLPISQQLQRMQTVQAMISARQQQQQRESGSHSSSGNPVGGFSHGPMSSLPNGPIPSNQMSVQNGSPTRASPVSHQSPGPSQSSQSSLPYPNQSNNMPLDPRTIFNSMTPQQQQTFANLPQHQRQLYLMQIHQQQIMRGGGSQNPGMMNGQMLAAARQQQQRMAQTSSPTQNTAMSGMGGANMDGSTFPALRSNPGVPGIARSTRTPSDHVPSPMTPQLSGRAPSQTPEDYQRAMIQHAQRGMTPQAQNSGASQLGGGGMQSSSWSQNSQMPQMVHGQGPHGMAPLGNAGTAHVGGYGVPSPTASQTWAHGGGGGGGGGGQFPFAAGSPAASQYHSDTAPTPRQTSATPAPHQQMSQNNPPADHASLNDFDLFNWGQQ